MGKDGKFKKDGLCDAFNHRFLHTTTIFLNEKPKI